jgi:hypothetical protein
MCEAVSILDAASTFLCKCCSSRPVSFRFRAHTADSRSWSEPVKRGPKRWIKVSTRRIGSELLPSFATARTASMAVVSWGICAKGVVRSRTNACRVGFSVPLSQGKGWASYSRSRFSVFRHAELIW